MQFSVLGKGIHLIAYSFKKVCSYSAHFLRTVESYESIYAALCITFVLFRLALHIVRETLVVKSKSGLHITDVEFRFMSRTIISEIIG
jgi:hypothetical protein